MGLAFTIDADGYAALDEATQAHYKEEDGGGYALDIDGDIPGLKTANASINEFRTKNIALIKERDELAKKNKELEGAKETGTEEKTALEKRLEKLEASLETEATARADAEKRVADAEFARIVRKAAKTAGVSSAAMDDAVDHLRARRAMRLDGDTVSAEDGTTLEDALKAMQKDTPYFFEPSKGAETGTGDGPTPGVSANAKKVGSILDNADAILKGDARYEPAAQQ